MVADSIESKPTTAAPTNPRLRATFEVADAPAAALVSELPVAAPLATRETEADDAAVAATPLERAAPRPATPFATVDASAGVAVAVRAAAILPPAAADVVEDVDTVVAPVAARPPATDAVRAAAMEAVVPAVVEDVDPIVVAAPPAIVTALAVATVPPPTTIPFVAVELLASVAKKKFFSADGASSLGFFFALKQSSLFATHR